MGHGTIVGQEGSNGVTLTWRSRSGRFQPSPPRPRGVPTLSGHCGSPQRGGAAAAVESGRNLEMPRRFAGSHRRVRGWGKLSPIGVWDSHKTGEPQPQNNLCPQRFPLIHRSKL